MVIESENKPRETIEAPIFVYGALRSGTTVFRLMLDSHPELANPGEVDFLFDFLHPDPTHPTGWRYNIQALLLDFVFSAYNLEIPNDDSGKQMDGLDLLASFLLQLKAYRPDAVQMTLNVHRHADRILEIFPHARFIHLLRDPRDVARSCIAMGWAAHPFTSVDFWLKTEEAWERSSGHIAPDQVLELKYEDLFRNVEDYLMAVCEFIGADWEPQMLHYYKNSTYGPPDPLLVEQWRTKADPDEIALVEGKAKHLMVARGYALSGTGRSPRSLEKFHLMFIQKIFVWRFGMKRYGAALFWGEKFSRWFGARKIHSQLRHRQNAIHRQLVR